MLLATTLVVLTMLLHRLVTLLLTLLVRLRVLSIILNLVSLVCLVVPLHSCLFSLADSASETTHREVTPRGGATARANREDTRPALPPIRPHSRPECSPSKRRCSTTNGRASRPPIFPPFRVSGTRSFGSHPVRFLMVLKL